MLTDRKITTYADNIKDLSDTPSSDGVTATDLKAKFDGRTDTEIKNAIKGIIDDLTSTTDGSSGADNIGATKLKDGGAETVQGQLEELYTDKVDKVLGKGLSTNDFTDEAVQTLANKVDKVAGKELSANDFTNTYKSKLDGVAENANNYSLPTASATTLGGIKIGAGLEILGDGTVNGVSPPAPDLYAREQIAQEITNRANADTEINQSISALNQILSGLSTKADITYYVNASTGVDSNDGLTSGTAFKTIQYAINKLPKRIEHTVTINVTSGTYAEDVKIEGFIGKDVINLYGDTVVSANYNVKSIFVSNCSISVTIRGFNSTTTTGNGFTVARAFASFSYCKTVSSKTYGFYITAAPSTTIINCELSNNTIAMYVSNCSTVLSSTNTGTGNTTVLYSLNGSTIAKGGTQPSGTTAETIATGGIIR